MEWHLNYQLPKPPFEIEYHHKILSLGSCFAENLAVWLKERHFNVLSNPNGVMFNPVSILRVLNDAIENPDFFDEKFLIYNEGYWKSFLHQTYFYSSDRKELIDKIIDIQKRLHQFLKTSDYLFITFGSAYIYEHVELREIVANCHKLPANIFSKKLLDVNTIVNLYDDFIAKIRNINAEIKIVLSVSPVKYLSYGLVNNTISKSILILSVHQLCTKHPNVYYFPAYELVTDDLRDYRFFKEDMAHPNDLAIKYVMQKFSRTLLSAEAQRIVSDIQRILDAKEHKITNVHSVQTKMFAEKMLSECLRIEKAYSHLNLSEEKKYFMQLL